MAITGPIHDAGLESMLKAHKEFPQTGIPSDLAAIARLQIALEAGVWEQVVTTTATDPA